MTGTALAWKAIERLGPVSNVDVPFHHDATGRRNTGGTVRDLLRLSEVSPS